MESRFAKLMSSEEMRVLGVDSMSEEQQKTLMDWGMRMYGLGQHVFGEIEKVKFDGRLVILDNGSRWEVEEFDAVTASLWDPMDKVVVIDGDMYKLDELEKVAVEEELG